MNLSRRQLLKILPATALFPGLVSTAFAMPAGIAENGNTTHLASAPQLRHYLRTGFLDTALLRGIASVAAPWPNRHITPLHLAASQGDLPRLDEMVAQLQALRGQALIIVVDASQSLWFDEALRELGASVLARGEHAVSADGHSRHHWMSAYRTACETAIDRRTGWCRAPASAWGALLGASLTRAGDGHGTESETSPFTAALTARAHPATDAPSRRLVSLVTRI